MRWNRRRNTIDWKPQFLSAVPKSHVWVNVFTSGKDKLFPLMFKASCNTYNQILSKYAEKCVLGLARSFLRFQRSVGSSEDRAADITGAL